MIPPDDLSRADDAPKPGEDTFSDADLAPTRAERWSAWRHALDWAAAIVAVGAAGVLAGGVLTVELGARPALGGQLPLTVADAALSVVQIRLDGIAVGCAALLLGCEVARTVVGFGRRTLGPRLRRITALLLGACAVYLATLVTPGIVQLRTAGVTRTMGQAGAELDRREERATLVRRVEVPLAALVIALHVLTLRPRRQDDDDLSATAPSPPGPRAAGARRAGRSAVDSPEERTTEDTE
jgi:hypothetical protein